jgi:dynactin complex subunit
MDKDKFNKEIEEIEKSLPRLSYLKSTESERNWREARKIFVFLINKIKELNSEIEEIKNG